MRSGKAEVFNCATLPSSCKIQNGALRLTTDSVSVTPSALALLCCHLLMHGLFSLWEGYGDGFDDVIIQGDLDELRFVAFYTR